jgi:anti-sigma-K factor RskA
VLWFDLLGLRVDLVGSPAGLVGCWVDFLARGASMSFTDHDRECEECGQAAAYVLRALEQEEAERYREHIADCAVCGAAVAELQPIADSLPAAVPGVVASEALRERIMGGVRSEAELLDAAGAGADRPQPARLRLRRPQLLTAGAALVAGLLIGAIVLSTGSQAPAVHVTTAQLASLPAGAHATLRQVGTHAELVVSGVSQPSRGKIYELWLAGETGAPRPTDALFGVTRGGSASVNVPGDLAGVRRVMVTAEPLGGSQHPTSSPIIVATLSSS